MKAHIDIAGRIVLTPETETELFALNTALNEARIHTIDPARATSHYYDGGLIVVKEVIKCT